MATNTVLAMTKPKPNVGFKRRAAVELWQQTERLYKVSSRLVHDRTKGQKQQRMNYSSQVFGWLINITLFTEFISCYDNVQTVLHGRALSFVSFHRTYRISVFLVCFSSAFSSVSVSAVNFFVILFVKCVYHLFSYNVYNSSFIPVLCLCPDS